MTRGVHRNGSENAEPSFAPASGPPARHVDPRVRVALDYIEREFGRRLQQHDVAATLGLSVSRFRHLFSRDVGHSFRDYLRRVRLRHAARLLRDVRLSVKQVALSSGYGNPGNFTRAFAKLYGSPPLEFRRGLDPKDSRFG